MKKNNIIGQKFGKLTVIEAAESSKSGHARWKCKCDCGNEITVMATNLKRGATTSCGCYQKEKAKTTKHHIDIRGQRFSRLMVLESAGKSSKGEMMWKCLCDCGNTTIVRGTHLTRGTIKSCGCIRNEEKKHGMARKHDKPRLYGIWVGMKQRCYNENNSKYYAYGAMGITVCDEWKNDFQAFYDWSMKNGYQENLTIDRKNVEGNYEPSNCRWATLKEQANNKHTNHFITCDGKTKTIAQWAEFLGIKRSQLDKAHGRGLNLENYIAELLERKVGE